MKNEEYSMELGSLGSFDLKLTENGFTVKENGQKNGDAEPPRLIKKIERMSKECGMTPADFIRISLRLGLLWHSLLEREEDLAVVEPLTENIERNLTSSEKR